MQFLANRSGNGDERSDRNGTATENPETHFVGYAKEGPLLLCPGFFENHSTENR
jgi:hypothetical protein